MTLGRILEGKRLGKMEKGGVRWVEFFASKCDSCLKLDIGLSIMRGERKKVEY